MGWVGSLLVCTIIAVKALLTFQLTVLSHTVIRPLLLFKKKIFIPSVVKILRVISKLKTEAGVLTRRRLSANVPSALQRHLSGTLCQHLF